MTLVNQSSDEALRLVLGVVIQPFGTDESKTIKVSWTKCIRPENDTYYYKLQEAMRYVVQDTIEYFSSSYQTQEEPRNKRRCVKNVAKRHGFITLKSITSNSWVFSLIIIFIRSICLYFLKTSTGVRKRIGLYFTKTTRCFETIGSNSLPITHVLDGFVYDALINDNLVTRLFRRII